MATQQHAQPQHTRHQQARHAALKVNEELIAEVGGHVAASLLEGRLIPPVYAPWCDDISQRLTLEDITTQEGEWYLGRTKSKEEKVFASELQDAHITYILPMQRTRQRVNERILDVTRVIYPGYIFFYGTLEERYLAKETRRLVQLVDIEDQVQVSTDLARLILMMRDISFGPVNLKPPIANRYYRVLAGPMEGLVGKMIRSGNRRSIVISLKSLGGSAFDVEVDQSNVEPI